MSKLATITNMVAWARELSTTPRNSWAAAPAPWVRCVKAPKTSANTGNGDKSPVHLGPVAAIIVSATTLAVATHIRTGRSHPGGWARPKIPAGTGIKTAVTIRSPQTSANAVARDNDTRSKIRVAARKADTPVPTLVHHAARRALQLYARQRTACDRRTSSVQTAAVAANFGPCSSARNIETGVEVSGRPAMVPPTPGPHRRANSVATATRAGVSRI